ncbi:MAG TPA: VOC family protein [Polyangiaceae bacterium]|jgi:predicted enzyme related to lactoylglutathione lyase
MNERPRFGFVVEYVRDIDAAKQFYVESFGLKVERTHPQYVQFEHFAIASDDSMGPGKERELYWLVDDAERAHKVISEHAVVSHGLEDKPFGKVFGIKGPAGEECFLLELSKNRESRVVAR